MPATRVRPPAASAPDVRSSATGPRSAEELLLAITLTTRWMLHTGRRLGQPPLFHHLGPEELLDFWADDGPGRGPA